MEGMDAEERECEFRDVLWLCVVLTLCAVFAIGQDGERKIKVWYDTPMGRLKSYSGR